MIVERINKENEIRFGPIQKCCGKHLYSCRCYTMDYWLENGMRGVPISVVEKLRK
jgi:hypothetical protein